MKMYKLEVFRLKMHLYIKDTFFVECCVLVYNRVYTDCLPVSDILAVNFIAG